MAYDKIEVPADGEQISAGSDGLEVPDNPIIPILHGDGIGKDVGPAAQRVLEAAANATGREISWMRVYAGQSAGLVEEQRRAGGVVETIAAEASEAVARFEN
jgi:isocitrate dehydrogenase